MLLITYWGRRSARSISCSNELQLQFDAPEDSQSTSNGLGQPEGHVGARILFSEGSSLTAREFLSVLGPAGHHIEIVDPNPICICRFSRWTKRVHRCPPASSDPLGYLDTINGLLAAGGFDVLLPTHEQAWLLAAGRARLDPDAPIAIASAEAFSRVQSKVQFARLLDEVGLPQPKWRVAERPEALADWPTPFYLKAPFSTAG